MAIDPRSLKPAELCRLLNSTPLGEVISERQLHRHRTRAGYRIGDGKTVDLLRYTAWMVIERHSRLAGEDATETEDDAFDGNADAARNRHLPVSFTGRDIDVLPEIVDSSRKEACRRNFRLFCETYFPQTFHLSWSPDHLKVIARIEQAVLEGGLFAMAMPRGSGKTSLCEIACLWALLYGHREFVSLIGSDEEHAGQMLESIKAELENSEALLHDFPEACFPIHCLDGIHQRAAGQLFEGRQTHIGWTAHEIVLPSIVCRLETGGWRKGGGRSDAASSPAACRLQPSASSGGIIRVAGITGRIRGMKYKRPDGRSVRPSLVLIDDPQTDESARSPSQCATRERILAGAILGLAGPGKKIAGLMTLTVVRPDDLADRLLDCDKHPQWQGQRTKMVYSFPTCEQLWAEYARLRAEGLRADEGITRATEFYGQRRDEMDEGAEVAWPDRFNHDEVSAIQHAMNLRLQDEAAFWAEYQNEPLPESTALDEDLLTAEQICAKISGHERGDVPIGSSLLTMFIDVQAKALFWLIVAWEEDFTGNVIDYGTEPDQKDPHAYFTLRDIRRTLAAASPRAGLEGAVYAGLERLTDTMLGREWKRDDGAMVRIDRCLIDANWGQSSDVVYQFCRQSRYANLVMPSHGRYVGASSIPFSEYKRKRGDRVGLNWRIPVITGKRAVRHVVFDTNYWKSFVHARLAVPMGDPGCLALFGRTGGSSNRTATNHQLLAEHLTSEYRVRTQGRGRTVDEWKLRVDGLDNHWLDCLVGCAVAASMQGAVLYGTDVQPAPRRRIRLSDLQGGRRR
ncbi:MAG: phage terminase large subunit family protein [Phycisphaerales bacterium]|nr:phage terminase large subunit family protein [Phycisphaerales bacterium]